MSPSELPVRERDWHRRVWLLAGPIILSNLSVPLVGAVDTAVVGHLPDPGYIGAVALGATIFNFVFWGFGFLRMGTTGLVAQAAGAGDHEEVRALVWRALGIGALMALALITLQVPIASLAFLAIDGSAELESLARDDYFAIRVWSAPATLANYAVLGALIGLQRTRAALVAQLSLNLVNVGLDLLFVSGFGWQVEGVALASVIAEYFALGVGLWLLSGALPRAKTRLDLARLLDRARLRAMFAVNGNLFVRTTCLLAGFFLFTAEGTRQGELILAANAVLLNLVYFLAYGLDGFAHAAEALAGGAFGAKRSDAFRAAVRATTIWAFIVAGLYSLSYWLAGPAIVALITDIEDVRLLADSYLPWLIAAPLVFVWSYQLDGIFIGTTHTREMRNGAILSLLVFIAAESLLVPMMGNHGLWLSLYLFMLARTLTLGLCYPRLIAALTPGR